MIEFCDESLGTSISSSNVCHDEYDVQNLISKSTQKRICGFMTERFVKPPVDVKVNFPLNIEISHIYIKNCVGAQKTTQFDILSCIGPISDQDSNTEFNDDDYSFIGRVSGDEFDKLLLVNKIYSRKRTDITNNSGRIKIFDLQRSNRNAISRSSSVIIRLRRTLNGGVPAIGYLQIWGYPSRSCMPDRVSSFLRLIENKKCAAGKTVAVKSENLSEVIPKTGISGNGDAKLSEIPSEFLDPLTCELYTLPMILPSGHTVNQSTIEKHNKAEESWGRPPNNPFTGVSFSGNSYPLPNVALKARLDDFMLKNSQLVQNAPRTVGRRTVKRKMTGTDADNYKYPVNELKAEQSTSHESELTSSLFSAISSVIGTNKYTLKPQTTDDCIFCGKKRGEDNFYAGACEHLICNRCVVKKKNDFCAKCGNLLLSNQIRKVNF